MAKDSFPHIFIRNISETREYTSPRSGGGQPKIPDRNRSKHGGFLKNKFEKLWEKAKAQKREPEAVGFLVLKTGI